MIIENRNLLGLALAGWMVGGMDEETIIEQLEELAARFGIQIRCEPIKQEEELLNIVGGLCLLKGEYVLIINSKATMKDKIRTIAEALKQFDLDQVYIRPALRELLDGTIG